MIPTIGPKQSKVWGSTMLAFAYNDIEVHAICVRKGGYCSQHLHRHKWNRFMVLSGQLEVSLYLDGPLMEEADVTIVDAGQVTDVPPGIVHQFKALEDTLAIEAYWVSLGTQDIERYVAGGISDG